MNCVTTFWLAVFLIAEFSKLSFSEPFTLPPSQLTTQFNTSANTKNERCAQTKLSYDVFTFYYKWRVENLLDYINYCKKFSKDFRLQSPDMVFETIILKGIWQFSLVYNPRSDSVELQGTFTNSRDSQRSSPEFELLCKIVTDTSETSLPERRSTHRVLQWSNIASQINNSSKNETVEFHLTANFYHGPELKNIVSENSYSCENDRSVEDKSSLTKLSYTAPFTNDLKSLMQDEKYVDVIIKTKNETDGIPAHRIILASSSPVLASLVYNSTFDKNESIINMEDIDIDIVKKLILYLYTGKIDAIENVADRLILVAYRFELNNLRDICESYLVKNIKLDNALKLYSLGMNTLSSTLSKRAFAVMRENKTKLAARSEEFRVLSTQYPNLMFELFVS